MSSIQMGDKVIYPDGRIEKVSLVVVANQQEHGMSFIDEVLEFNRAAGRPETFDARMVANHTGFQLEELAEKLDAILVGAKTESQRLHVWQLAHMAKEIASLGQAFKVGTYDSIVEGGDRHEMLDADVDICVVSIGSMQTAGADVSGACLAVSGANMAKRFDDGKFHLNENGKIVKPANWKPADLTPFVGK